MLPALQSLSLSNQRQDVACGLGMVVLRYNFEGLSGSIPRTPGLTSPPQLLKTKGTTCD